MLFSMVPMATGLLPQFGALPGPLRCVHRNSSLPSLHITLGLMKTNISPSLFQCLYLCIFLYLPLSLCVSLSSLIHTLASD